MRRLFPVPALVAAVLLSGCGGGEPPKDGVPSTTTPPTSAPTSTAPPTEPTPTTAPTTAPTSAPAATPTPTEQAAPVLGIDASHHQGSIDWAKVADHGITFAYLKATEGSGFTDPRFAGHRAAALRQGVRVGGYHYFQLCSDGVAQAIHFVEVLGDNGGARGLPPAIDLELAGSCDSPPPRADLLAEVRAFLDTVEQAVGAEPVVYLYPEFEERYGFARELADHPQWVRRLGRAEPQRAWHIWQYDDRGSVPGVAGGVDLDRMQPPG